jgi:hypothetical protein
MNKICDLKLCLEEESAGGRARKMLQTIEKVRCLYRPECWPQGVDRIYVVKECDNPNSGLVIQVVGVTNRGFPDRGAPGMKLP